MNQSTVNSKSPKFVLFVFKEARKLETKDINDNIKPFWGRNLRYIISLGAAIAVILTLHDGFATEFLELTATILSIFIGLFPTALIFALDKCGDVSSGMCESPDSPDNLFAKQSRNYIRQFNLLIGKNVLLCVVTLALVGVNILYPEIFTTNPFDYAFVKPTCGKSVMLFAGLTMLIVQRGTIIYLLVSIFYDTVRIVSSLVNYMDAYIDRNKNQ